MHLFEALAGRVTEWRSQHYPSDAYPAIAEILEWAANPDFSAFRLRAPQLRALETYWYLRLVAGTPHIFDLYKQNFNKTTERLAALGMSHPDITALAADEGFDGIVERVQSDDAFVKTYKLEALRETLRLDYPSYILALAMGAGKTVLIGAIFASEFAMALEYPDGSFVENALIFAPGKTIIESLRELAEMRYEAVLPPRMYKSFAATLKLTFTRDGDPDIPIIKGSSFNVIVTNTEKIRIQKETIRKSDLGSLFSAQNEDQARAEIANLRLQAIASLPKLAIFSDEAHHTYGQKLDQDLKKVRKTVDYLYNPYPAGTPEHEAHQSNLICVVNTTGTPYFEHQPLRDVVVWYGLSEGIRDGILKEVADNIQGFNFDGDVEGYLSYIVADFFRDYGAVCLPDGTPAKLAIFFPQTDDLQALRPVIETTLLEMGLPTTLILEHHTKHENKADFDRFKTKDSPHRIALLVDRGVEGWNVPALFACALARKLKSSNNFVLQAASRCLRQVPGNKQKARIYLSLDNQGILDRQLQETYGESFGDLTRTPAHSRLGKITLRKIDIPPLVVRKLVRRVEPVRELPNAANEPNETTEQSEQRQRTSEPIHLTLPEVAEQPALEKVTFTLGETPGDYHVLSQVGQAEVIVSEAPTVDRFTAADDLARTYRLDPLALLKELRRLYPDSGLLPRSHLGALAEQIEAQTRRYQVVEETVEVALALVKKEGFARETDADGHEVYTAEISYPIDREDLLTSFQEWQDHANGFGFHYDPYNFDSHPEQNFFSKLLDLLKLNRDEIDDIYFTGGINDPQKTDFFVEYLGEDGSWHRYVPDFVIRKADGKCLIVEIKKEHDRAHPVDGEHGRKAMATRQWTELNPDRLQYHIAFVERDEVGYEQIQLARDFIQDE